MKKSQVPRSRRAWLRQAKVRDAKQWQPGASGLYVKRERRGGRKRELIIGTLRSAGGVMLDPAVAYAYELRRALRPPVPGYARGVCRRIDPTTGEVIGLIDPITRVETPVSPARP